MKNILIPLVLILSNIAFAKSSALNSHDIVLKDSLLWKITGNELKQPSFLYGTFHMICKNPAINKKKVKQAISESDQLYLEINMTDPNEMKYLLKKVSSGEKLKT